MEYVSFDVYDTLISRILQPQEIYEIMEARLEEGENPIRSFCQKRISAQKSLDGENYTLQDIYSSSEFADLSAEVIHNTMNLERKLELNNAVPNWEMKKMYEQYSRKYKVICISDMYFDLDFIQELLHKNGYDPYKIYVSSDVKRSKKDKDIFGYVMEDLHVGKNKILHIGDALRSDWLYARQKGMRSKWIHRKQLLNPSGDYLYNIGYGIFGPVMFEFCRWIHGHDEDGKLLFLSREGEFIKQCYDIMYPYNDADVIYFSRKAVLQGTAYLLLQNDSTEEFCSRICLERYENIRDVFRRLGLNAEKYEEEIRRYGLSLEDRYNDDIRPFFKENRDSLMKDMKAYHDVFEGYLTSHLKRKNVLVDIGWEGRMQTFLGSYLELKHSEIEIKGLYFGIKNKKSKQGFLFEENKKCCQDILCFSGLLEIIMMPCHGSTIGYRKEGDEVVPIFDSLEFTEMAYDKIKRIQNGIQDLIRKCTPMLPCQCFEKENVSKRMIRFGCHPDKNAIQELGSLELYENGETHSLIGEMSLKKLKKIPEGFIYSKWKSGYLKKLFCMDLPYEYLISYLRKRVGGGTDL